MDLKKKNFNKTTQKHLFYYIFWLAGVRNFCSNSPSPFLSIVHILSFQAISFQILLYALLSRFPCSTLLPFPSYFNFHNLTYLGIDVSMHDYDHTTADSFELSSIFTTPSLSRRTSVNTLSTSLTSHIILIIRHTLLNLLSSATVSFHVSQHYKKTGLT